MKNKPTIQFDIIYFFQITDVKCPFIPLPLGYDRSANATSYKSMITYWCTAGFASVSYTNFWTLECMDDGTWSSVLPSCDGMMF